MVGDGVGDKGAESRSWAYDGGRQRKWSYGWLSYGNHVKWKAGDVVGCLLDLDTNQVSFSLNGENLGIAFDEVTASKVERIFPAASLKGGPHLLVFDDCLYCPDGYRLFAEAPEDGLMPYTRYNEAPVRSFLGMSAAQQAAAWIPAPKFMKAQKLSALPSGSQILYADTGISGKVTKFDKETGHHLIAQYDADFAEGFSAKVELAKTITKNHLTIDTTCVEDHIETELEAAMERYEEKKERSAIVAERAAASFIEKQRQAAEEESRQAEAAPEKELSARTQAKKKKQEKKAEREARRKRGELTEEQQQTLRKQRLIFDVFDTDGSGEISLDEMMVIAETDGYDLTDKEVQTCFEEMDTDGSGEVCFEEFQLWLEDESSLAIRLWVQSGIKLLKEQESRVYITTVTDQDVLIGGHITDKSDWATLRACRLVAGGRWYYEVLLGDNTSCLIGYACTDMVIDEVEQGKRPLGLGELGVSGSSWAYDGSRGVKLHKGPLPYAANTKWKTHDVVGCILDLDAGTISYTLNGTNLGVAFQAVQPEATESIFPAVTLQGGPHWMRFGRHELSHAPDDCRLFGTSKKWNEQKDKRESKTRRRAYRRAKHKAEQMKKAWVQPTKYSASQLGKFSHAISLPHALMVSCNRSLHENRYERQGEGHCRRNGCTWQACGDVRRRVQTTDSSRVFWLSSTVD